MSIQKTIFMCFIFLGLLIFLSSYILTRTTSRTLRNIEGFHHLSLEHIQTINSDLLEAVEESFAYLVSGRTDERDEFFQWENKFQVQAENYVKIAKLNTSGEEKEKELFDSVIYQQANLVRIAHKLFTSYQHSNSVTLKNFDEYESAVDSISKQISKLVTIEKMGVAEVQNLAFQKIKRDRKQILGIGTGALILCIVFGRIISKHVNKEIILRMKAEGQLEERKDELEKINKELKGARQSLENRVWDRTAKLARSNNELEVSRIRLRELNKKIRTVREKEKIFLAREIHDELGQVITYCKLELQWVINAIKTPGEKIDKKLASMVSHLDSCLASVRRISTELRPQILDLMGISEAIKWQAQKFKDQTLIELELNIVPEVIECGRDMSVDLFRIFQEIMTNIARHAEADLVQIFFVKEKDYYRLIVKDNGKGFNVTSPSDLQSFGILGIRERAICWDGSVNIESQPDLGTTVTANIPIHRHQ